MVQVTLVALLNLVLLDDRLPRLLDTELLDMCAHLTELSRTRQA